MDRVSKAKVDSLLAELRSWPAGELRSDVESLARRFRLDPMIIRRIAQTEGVVLEPETAPSPRAAASATDFIRVEDVEAFGRGKGD